MSEATLIENPPPQAPSQPLTCRLRPKSMTGRNGPITSMAEIELENNSTGPLDIAYRMTALQYLNLIVTNAAGEVISEGHFGDRFAPTLEPLVLRLDPGKRFSANVHLLATVHKTPLPPGCYTVQAIYEYNGFRAVSNQVDLRI